MRGEDDPALGPHEPIEDRTQSRVVVEVFLAMQRQNVVIAADGLDAVLLQRQQQRIFHQITRELDAMRLVTLGLQITDVGLFFEPSGFREHIDYRENSLLFTFNQLIHEGLSLGARYRLSHAELDDDFTDVPDSAITTQGFRSRFRLEAMLHQLSLSANYNHAGGFFSQFQALWNSQSNQGYDPDRPGDDFWQLNVSAGYRFLRRHAEVTIGVLNLTDRDYRLDPLTFYNELPRERTFVARLQFNF